MKLFEKWRDTESTAFEDVDAHSIIGTPVSANGEDLRDFMLDVEGFSPGADAYVYTVVLRRQSDGTRWYYIGQTTDGEEGLKNRFEKHVRGKMTKTVRREGVEVLDGPLTEDTTDAYVAIGIDRAESISLDTESLLRPHVLEQERRMAYEVAIEKETTNVLGGR